MAGNRRLAKAKSNKKDEFYTQLIDIENELKHYREHFKDKIVFCNCDDPYESNFFKYFAMNFNHLGLKKLICTCYDSSPIAYTQLSFLDDIPEKITPNKNRKAYKIEITEVLDYNGDGAVDLADVTYLLKNNKNSLSLLKGDGDFRSQECIDLLKECDIVVTNPPFSLFREYVSQLVEYDKRFLIIGNMNAITYREIFSLIKQNKLWAGYGFNMSMVCKTPYENNLESNKKFVKSKGFNPNDNYIKVPAVNWYTNLETIKRTEDLILYKQFISEEYPIFFNYDAINVNKVSDIPCDYSGCMGVPITFLDKYNPNQFEIVGLGISNSGLEIGVRPYTHEHKKYRKEIQRKGAVDGDLYMLDKNGHPLVPYARIIIRRKK